MRLFFYFRISLHLRNNLQISSIGKSCNLTDTNCSPRPPLSLKLSYPFQLPQAIFKVIRRNFKSLKNFVILWWWTTNKLFQVLHHISGAGILKNLTLIKRNRNFIKKVKDVIGHHKWCMETSLSPWKFSRKTKDFCLHSTKYVLSFPLPLIRKG